MSMSMPPVRVGLGVLIRRSGRVLLHRRLSKHQYGTWATPGGHLDPGESFVECLEREISEEAGPDLVVSGLRFWALTNCIYRDEGLHYVVPIFVCDWVSGEARVMEPTKCECWEWFPWENLPSPLISSIDQISRSSRSPF